MKKENLFEALGEISSKTVQMNTAKRYRERILTSYIKWAAVAAAIIVAGTGFFVFRIADSTHGAKENIAASMDTIAGESAYIEAEEEAPAEEANVEEAPAELPGGAYFAESAACEEAACEEAAYEESADEMPAAEAVKDSGVHRVGDFGLEIKLPESATWIQEISRTESDNLIKVVYEDYIAGADCVLYGVNSETEKLPEVADEISFDDSLDETWEATAPDGKTIYLKVKHSEDKENILIKWDYKQYNFEVIAHFTGDERDTAPVAKTALFVIKNLKPSQDNSISSTPSHTENAN